MSKLNAQQLRTSKPNKETLKKMKRHPIYIICDNVLDTYNVGAIFRLADATACEKVYLCAGTETPPNTKIKKASINTWQWVAWSYEKSAAKAIKKLKKSQKSNVNGQRLHIVAIEQHKNSISLKSFKPEFPLVLVVGNETYGVAKDVLKLADEIVELPMYGANQSLNVMVSLGIVLYKVMEFV